jgi:hypothetical protein
MPLIFCEVAQQKALLRAKQEKAHVNDEVMNIEAFKAGRQYDAIELIYVYLELGLRQKFHTKIA